MMIDLHPVEKEQVMAFLDGELEPKLAAQVAAHIRGCSECRKLQGDLREVSSQVLNWVVEPAPSKLTQVVDAEAQAVPNGPVPGHGKVRMSIPLWRRVVFSRITWATACLVLCIGIVLKVFAPAHLYAPFQDQSSIATQRESEGISALARVRRAPPPNSAFAWSTGERGGGGNYIGPGSNARPADLPQDLSIGPMIAHTALLKVSVKDVGVAREAVDKIVRQHWGYAASMTMHSEVGAPRTIESEVHIPAEQIDSALTALKALGRVEQEEQGGEEVTAQVIDLDARLKNAREAEIRLQDIMRTRTGKVSDVLEVEKVITDTRESIERMEAERKELRGRVAYSSIKLELHEEYQATLGTGTPVGGKIRNAIVDGFQAAGSGALAVFLWLLNVGPSLLLVALTIFWPARWAWRRHGKGWREWMERGRTPQL